MNKFSKIPLVVFGFFILFFVLSTTVLAARESEDSTQACIQDAKQCSDGSWVSRTGPNCEFALCPPVSTSTGNRPQTKSSPASNLDIGNTAANDSKLRACQAREEAVKKRAQNLTNLANNIFSKFDSIASRVKDFYTNKVVLSGKTVADYDVLISEIDAKKLEVQNALSEAETDIVGFSCASGDPKTQLINFKEDMLKVKVALKNYRTSIKNLIVAVHSVTGSENEGNPKPSRSPKAPKSPGGIEND